MLQPRPVVVPPQDLLDRDRILPVPPLVPAVFACAAAVVVGAFGPWATVDLLWVHRAVGGMQTQDGPILAGAGVLALLCLGLAAAFKGRDGELAGLFGAGLVLGLSGLGAWDDAHNLAGVATSNAAGGIAVGWGLDLIVWAGGLGAVLALLAVVLSGRLRSRPGLRWLVDEPLGDDAADA